MTSLLARAVVVPDPINIKGSGVGQDAVGWQCMYNSPLERRMIINLVD